MDVRNAHTYTEIALRLEDEFSESISSITNPCDAWLMLETTYGAQQTGIQGVITAELTLARWDGQTPINAHHDHMTSLRACLSAAGLNIGNMQFYQYFTNSFPAEYDMVPGIFNPALTGHSVDYLCEQIRGIKLCRELHTAHPGGTCHISIPTVHSHDIQTVSTPWLALGQPLVSSCRILHCISYSYSYIYTHVPHC